MSNDPGWDALQAQIAALGAAGGGTAPKGPSASSALGGNYLAGGKAPMVYWGKTPDYKNTRGGDSPRDDAMGRLGIVPGGPHEVTLQSAVDDWYSWSEAEKGAFAQRLYRLGLLQDASNIYGQSGAFTQWQNAVQLASNYYTAAGKPVTPWQAVDLMAGTAMGGRKPTTQTQSSTSVNVPTIEDAHALSRGIYQSLMGRDPNQNEMHRLSSMITGYAQKHPTKTTTTQTTDLHGNTTSSSSSSGGYTQAGLQDMLTQHAKADPEYGAYQAAVPLWNAVIREMGGLTSGNG